MKRLIVMLALVATVLSIAGTALAEHGPRNPIGGWSTIETMGNGAVLPPWDGVGIMEHGPRNPIGNW